jgi:hypothetical protein
MTPWPTAISGGGEIRRRDDGSIASVQGMMQYQVAPIPCKSTKGSRTLDSPPSLVPRTQLQNLHQEDGVEKVLTRRDEKGTDNGLEVSTLPQETFPVVRTAIPGRAQRYHLPLGWDAGC